MIKSLAEAGRALGRSDFTQLASDAAQFVLDKLRRDERLLRSYKDGQAKLNGYLEDYAFFAEALIELYQATFDLHWYEEAGSLSEAMVDLFWSEGSGFYDTARDHEGLITRPQEITDNAIPSGTSGAVAVLLRIAIYADRPEWRERAERIIARLSPAIQEYPSAFAYLASQLEFALSAPHEIALISDPSATDLAAMLEVLNRDYRPDQITALGAPDDDRAAKLIPLLADRDQLEGKPTVYVCHNYVCQLPVNTAATLEAQLRRTSAA
jgi:uncharacterized protein YyaL (SSP411 family)